MFNNIYSYIIKGYKFFDNLIFKKEEKKSITKSILVWIPMIILLVVNYYISNEYYLDYNFNINPGIMMRVIKILPIFALITYCYFNILPNKIKSIEMLFWMLFYILTLVPTLVVYVMNGIGDQKNIIIYIYLFEIIAVGCIYVLQNFNLRIPKIKISEKVFWILLIIFCAFGYGYIIKHLGIPSFKSSLADIYNDIYKVRLNYRKIGNRYDDYFVQWLGNIINPFIFSYMLRNRKYKLATIPVVLELILFMYTAYKSLLVILVLAPVFAYVVNRGVRKSFLEISSLGLLTLGVITGLIHRLTFYVLLGQRIFIWPSLIALQYYDFFSMYPKMKLGHSILGHFFPNKYLMEPSFYISSLYYNRPQMRLNTNWYADAYTNFGFIGIIIFAILLLAMFLFIKSMEDKDVYLICSLLFGGIVALFNNPLLTTMLTSGLGMGLLIAFILPVSICKKNGGFYE